MSVASFGTYFPPDEDDEDEFEALNLEFEALNLPPVPCGVKAGSRHPSESVYTFDDLIAFAIEARKTEPDYIPEEDRR